MNCLSAFHISILTQSLTVSLINIPHTYYNVMIYQVLDIQLR